MARKRDTKKRALQGGALTLDEYGLHGFPAFSYEDLPGADVRDKAAAYVAALDLEPSVRRGMILWRCECVLEDYLRDRDGRPSFEEEVLTNLLDVP